jgi:hypothetical protein
MRPSGLELRPPCASGFCTGAGLAQAWIGSWNTWVSAKCASIIAWSPGHKPSPELPSPELPSPELPSPDMMLCVLLAAYVVAMAKKDT